MQLRLKFQDCNRTGRHGAKFEAAVGFLQHRYRNPLPGDGFVAFDASSASLMAEFQHRYNDKKSP